MKTELEKIFQGLTDNEHEIKCFLDILKDYKSLAIWEEQYDLENRLIILVKVLESIYADSNVYMEQFDRLLMQLSREERAKHD